MGLTIGRTKLRLHPLALVFPLAAALLGAGEAMAALAVSLAVHEAAHLAMARTLGVGIGEVRIMPIGGAIRLENPYVLSPGRLLAVAAAGPAGSLLALLVAAALAHWRALDPVFAVRLMETNLVLLGFNLLPALPLDGGRMLYALLSERLGRNRAVEVGILLGRIVAGLLSALALVPVFLGGRLNLTPLFAAAFILLSAEDERHALGDARLRTWLSELKPLSRPVPARVVAVGGECDARLALRAARADALTLYAVYENSRLMRFTDDRRLLRAVIENDGDIAVGKACEPL